MKAHKQIGNLWQNCEYGLWETGSPQMESQCRSYLDTVIWGELCSSLQLGLEENVKVLIQEEYNEET